MTKDLFDKYIWLVDVIYRSRKITFEEINERWLRSSLSDGQDIPLRTFHNWRAAIEQIFDINIECNRKGGYYYYIENVDDLENNGLRNWLLNTFSVNNLLVDGHNLNKRILFEYMPSDKGKGYTRFLGKLSELTDICLRTKCISKRFLKPCATDMRHGSNIGVTGVKRQDVILLDLIA